MGDSTEHQAMADEPGARFVTIPVRARDEIGELAFYLEQVRQNLLEVNIHLTGSSRTVPDVLHDLKDIVQMTEKATVRVLEETEALLEEGQVVSDLVAEAQREAGERALSQIGRPLSQVQALVARGNNRAMAIMSALEFQDLTSQKVQRAFEVLEEVGTRLAKIHGLVSLGQEVQPKSEPAPREESMPSGGKSGQDLADEILLRFRG
jgi:chemotaxis regulatin CheY-phosphate phosphatase CheZ